MYTAAPPFTGRTGAASRSGFTSGTSVACASAVELADAVRQKLAKRAAAARVRIARSVVRFVIGDGPRPPLKSAPLCKTLSHARGAHVNRARNHAVAARRPPAA